MQKLHINEMKKLQNRYYLNILLYIIDFVGILSASYIYINTQNFILSMNQDINHTSTVINIEYIWIYIVILLLKSILVYFLEDTLSGTLDVDTRIFLFVIVVLLNICTIIFAFLSFLLYQLKTDCIDYISLKYFYIHRIWKEKDLTEYLFNKFFSDPYILHQLTKLKIKFPITDEFISSILNNCKTKKDVKDSVYNVILKLREEKSILENKQKLDISCTMNKHDMDISNLLSNYSSWNTWGTYLVVGSAVMIVFTLLITFQIAESVDREALARDREYKSFFHKACDAMDGANDKIDQLLKIKNDEINHKTNEALTDLTNKTYEVLYKIETLDGYIEKTDGYIEKTDELTKTLEVSVNNLQGKEKEFLEKINHNFNIVDAAEHNVNCKIKLLENYGDNNDRNTEKLTHIENVLKANGLMPSERHESFINLKNQIKDLAVTVHEIDKSENSMKIKVDSCCKIVQDVVVDVDVLKKESITFTEELLSSSIELLDQKEQIETLGTKFDATSKYLGLLKELSKKNNSNFKRLSEITLKSNDNVDAISEATLRSNNNIEELYRKIAENNVKLTKALTIVRDSKIEDEEILGKHVIENTVLFEEFKDTFESRVDKVEAIVNYGSMREMIKQIVTKEEIVENDSMREMIKEIIKEVMSQNM